MSLNTTASSGCKNLAHIKLYGLSRSSDIKSKSSPTNSGAGPTFADSGPISSITVGVGVLGCLTTGAILKANAMTSIICFK